MRNLLLAFILVPTLLRGQDCSIIKTEKDKFTGEISYKTPILDDVSFYKYILQDTLYVVRLTAYSNSANFGDGVIILFDSGAKIVKDNERIDIKVNQRIPTNYRYYVTAFVSLTREELWVFSVSNITDFRLYIYEASVKPKKAEQYKNYASCILSK